MRMTAARKMMVAKFLFSWYLWSSRLCDKNPRECSNRPEGQRVNDSVEMKVWRENLERIDED